MKIRYMNDLFHPILAFAILVVTALALKGGAPYSHEFSPHTGVVRGLFVGYFTGHTHYDCVGYLKDFPDQLNVSVARYDGNTAAASCINRYTDNAITFNYCVVDKKCGTITIYRVGCQDTFSGYKRDLFVGKWL